MSDNLWGDLKRIKDVSNPLDILIEQSGYLLDATENMLYTDSRIREVKTYLDEPDKEFATVYSIQSKMMEKYEFQLFTIYYDIIFYPMIIELDENIAEELNSDIRVTIGTNEDFKEILKKVLSSNFTKQVISSIYAMSK